MACLSSPVHRLCPGAHAACVDSVKENFLLPLLLKGLTPLSQRERVLGGRAGCYQAFLCNSFTLIVVLLKRIKTCEIFQPNVEIIEGKQFPTEESTPLIRLGFFCSSSILPLHFIPALPRSGNGSCCGQITASVLSAHTFSRVCNTCSFPLPDGGVGRCPAEQPGDCQHPGHRRQ